jgi:hypothetical protein
MIGVTIEILRKGKSLGKTDFDFSRHYYYDFNKWFYSISDSNGYCYIKFTNQNNFPKELKTYRELEAFLMMLSKYPSFMDSNKSNGSIIYSVDKIPFVYQCHQCHNLIKSFDLIDDQKCPTKECHGWLSIAKHCMFTNIYPDD